MSIVIDASVAATFVLPDEQNELSKSARRIIIDRQAFAPTIFWYEVRNVVLINERRSRLDASAADAALRQIDALPITLMAVESRDVLSLARAHRLSAYDASYLALARNRGLPLFTLDKALAGAARREGVALNA